MALGGAIGTYFIQKGRSKLSNPEISIHPETFEFKSNQNIKNEFRIVNQNNKPYYNIWIKIEVKSDLISLSDFSINIDPNTAERHKKRVVKVNHKTFIQTYAYMIRGQDENGTEMHLINIAFIDPGETVGIEFINNSNTKSKSPSLIKAAVVTHSNLSSNNMSEPRFETFNSESGSEFKLSMTGIPFEFYMKNFIATTQNDIPGFAEHNTGLMFDNAGHFEEAYKWYSKSATLGNEASQFNLGIFYGLGLGVEKDYAKAAKFYEMAISKGYAPAETNLAVLYLEGWGVEKNLEKAFELFYKAANKGESLAQKNLGIAYENGYGTKVSFEKANHWYSLACDQGEPEAQYNLGLNLLEGKGIRKNENKAYELIKKSADAGLPRGIYTLGKMYADGYGTTRNQEKAIELFKLAAESGDELAIEALIIIKKQIQEQKAHNK